MRLRALALVAVALVAPLSAGARPAAPAATVIDRTRSCSATPDTVRKFRVSAVSGFRDPANRQRWKWTANFAAESRGLTVAYVNAGDLPESRWRAMGINMAKCRTSAGRVPLSARGLTGGLASQLQGSDAYECVVTGRVLVRVRAVFRAPPIFRVRRAYGEPISETSTPVREAQLAIRTLTGKALAYATASEAGKATLFTAPSCVSD